MIYIVLPILAGFIATAGITLTLWLINKTGWTNADMVRAIGSLFTKDINNSLRIGLFVHFVGGIIISGVYLHILSILKLTLIIEYLLVGSILGFVHGFILSFGIVIFAEHHPVKEFQEADFEVAIAHILGHVAYGLIIGAIFAVLQIQGMNLSPAV